MDRLTQRLFEHYVNFPDIEIQDAVKFLYQHFMGPGHLIMDEQAALARLRTEWDSVVPDADAPLSLSLENDLCRLNFNCCKAHGLSYKTIARLFFLTASRAAANPAALAESLDLIYSLPFPREQVSAYLTEYRTQGCPMVSHSEHYRRKYHPAYRVVSEYYVNIIPALLAIDRALAAQDRLFVAIDGPCASGKSTLGAALSEIYRCSLIHMDDFFLRPHQRTPQRLAQPGGNVDYERLSREVLSPLLRGEPARYRPFQCHKGDFGPEITADPAPLTVVEGCYCLRPDLRNAFSVRIWLEAPWEIRRLRLLERGGPDCLARFEKHWIPLEESYFRSFQIPQCCSIFFCGDRASRNIPGTATGMITGCAPDAHQSKW